MLYLLILLFPFAASGASMHMHTIEGATIISPGEFTLVLHGTTVGGEMSAGFDVELFGGGAVEWTGATQVAHTGFDLLPTSCMGTELCMPVNQISKTIFDPAPAVAESFFVATVTGIALTAGTITAELSGYFDAAMVDNVMVIVPEPGTALLLGCGLFVLFTLPRRYVRDRG